MENTTNSNKALNSNQNISSDNNGNMRPLYSLLPPNEFYNIPEDVRNSLPQSSIDDWKSNAKAYGYDPNMIHNNMNGMLDFLFENNANIRIIVNGSTPDCTLFCGPDVGRVLGYADDHTRDMYRMLNEYEKVVININTAHIMRGILDSSPHNSGGTSDNTPHNSGGILDNTRGNSAGIPSRGNPNVVFITLPGLFRLIASSRRPEAMRFQNWVYHVVLPSIWSYGYYASPNTRTMLEHSPNIVHDLNTKISELESKNSEYINKINEMEPYANMGNFMLSNMHPITIEELAKVLNSSGINIGRNRLFKLLAEDGYLMKTGEGNRPTQKALNMGIMTYSITPLPNGAPYTYVYVLPKGILYFINKYANYTNE